MARRRLASFQSARLARSRSSGPSEAKNADIAEKMEDRPPDCNLVLQPQRGGPSCGALLDRHVAMGIAGAARDQLHQRLRLVGKTVGLDLDCPQQRRTMQNGTVVIADVEPEQPVEQGREPARREGAIPYSH